MPARLHYMSTNLNLGQDTRTREQETRTHGKQTQDRRQTRKHDARRVGDTWTRRPGITSLTPIAVGLTWI